MVWVSFVRPSVPSGTSDFLQIKFTSSQELKILNESCIKYKIIFYLYSSLLDHLKVGHIFFISDGSYDN